ncbi:MAG: hypothetical protein KGL39_06935 [Patescibacteria group bacterium]|nr:hypothetical protein [Patescibacteria group bacterium]
MESALPFPLNLILKPLLSLLPSWIGHLLEGVLAGWLISKHGPELLMAVGALIVGWAIFTEMRAGKDAGLFAKGRMVLTAAFGALVFLSGLGMAIGEAGMLVGGGAVALALLFYASARKDGMFGAVTWKSPRTLLVMAPVSLCATLAIVVGVLNFAGVATLHGEHGQWRAPLAKRIESPRVAPTSRSGFPVQLGTPSAVPGGPAGTGACDPKTDPQHCVGGN